MGQPVCGAALPGPCKWRWTGRQLRFDSVGAVASPVARSFRREGESARAKAALPLKEQHLESEPINI